MTTRSCVLILCALLICAPALVSAGQPASSPAPLAPAGGESLPGGPPIVYLASRGAAPFHIPAPAFPGTARAQSATFTINYLPAGSHNLYDDDCEAWPSAARTAFSYAANIWGQLLNSSVPVVINACWASNLPYGVLGHSGVTSFYRDFSGAPQAGTWYGVALANALHGSDLNGSEAEMEIAYASTGIPWYFGTDGNTPTGQYDLVSVVLHEIGHGLDFAGTMTVSSGQGSWGGGTGYPRIYDRFTRDGNGTSLINTSVYPNPSVTLGSALRGQVGGGVYFHGANAMAANGGNRVKLYSPSVWQGGSSYAHLDEIFNGTINALMTYSLDDGESNHNPGPITLGLLRDVGWPAGSAVTPTPTRTATRTLTPTRTRTATRTPIPPTATPTPTRRPGPDVSIVKRVVGSSFKPGDRITFTLTIANQGNRVAANVVVTDILPSQVQNPTYDSTLSITPKGGSITLPNMVWDVQDLAPGKSGVIHIYGRINPSLPTGFSFVNRAIIADPQDVDRSNNSSQVVIGGLRVYLGVILNNWPPLPKAPALSAIDNTDGNGAYSVTWNAATGANTYTLQEDDNGSFSSPAVVYGPGSARAWSASNKAAGTYCYRVQGNNTYGAGPWSNVQCAGVGPKPGFWEDPDGIEFYVTSDRAHVHSFAVYVHVDGCGNYKIIHPIDEPISNNSFGWSGAYYASGTFKSSTTASGQVGLSNFLITGCAYVNGGPWTWSATWQSSQAAPLSVEAVSPDAVVPATVPGRFIATRVP